LGQFLKEYFPQRTESTLDRSMSLRYLWEQSWILKPGGKMVERKKSLSESWGNVVTSKSDGGFSFWEESAGSSSKMHSTLSSFLCMSIVLQQDRMGSYSYSRVPQEDQLPWRRFWNEPVTYSLRHGQFEVFWHHTLDNLLGFLQVNPCQMSATKKAGGFDWCPGCLEYSVVC